MITHVERIILVKLDLKFKLSLCDYSDAYILVSSTVTIKGGPNDANGADKRADERNKKIIYKNCAPIFKSTSEKDNTQIDHAKHLDIVNSMCNLMQYKTIELDWTSFKLS